MSSSDISSTKVQIQHQSIDVKLDGTNYRVWAYTVEIALRSRQLWDNIDGTITKPVPPTLTKDDATDARATESYKANLLTWKKTEDKAIAAIIQSVIPSIRLQLKRFKTSSDLWHHLQISYTQADDARYYQLYQEVHTATQGDRTINDFYTYMYDLWSQLEALEPPLPDPESQAIYDKMRDQQRLFQLMMKIRPEFENARGLILHTIPRPSLDKGVAELRAEELRLQLLAPTPEAPAQTTIFAAPRAPRPRNFRSSFNQSSRPTPNNNSSPRPSFNGATTPQSSPNYTGERQPEWCSNHQMWGHSTRNCRKKPSSPSQAAIADSTTSSMTPDDIQTLLRSLHIALPQPSTPGSSTFIAANSGSENREDGWDWP